MFLEKGRTVIYRPWYLSPHQETLLGLVWIAAQQNRERGREALVESFFLDNLIFVAQNRQLIDSAARFQSDSSSASFLETPWLKRALQELKDADLLCIPENGEIISFSGNSFFSLPTGIFRHLRVFRLAGLVEELTTGGEP